MASLAFSINISEQVRYVRTGKTDPVSPEWIHPTAHLEDYELILVTKGILYLQMGNTRYVVSPNEYILLEPQRVSSADNRENIRRGFQKSSCAFYWLHFQSQKVTARNSLQPDLVDDIKDHIILPRYSKLRQSEKVIFMLIQLQDSVRSHYHPHYYDLLSTLILCELSEQRITGNETPEKSMTGSVKACNDIKDYVQACKNENLRIADIAKRFGYHEKYISRLFFKNEGISLKNYIIEQKLDQAKLLLLDSNMTVSEIAGFLGFSSYHTFERMFLKNMTMTPSAYRKLYTGRITNYR